MTTKGSVKNAKLPSGPTDNCPAAEVTAWLMNVTLTNETTSINYLFNTTASAVTMAVSESISQVATTVAEP